MSHPTRATASLVAVSAVALVAVAAVGLSTGTPQIPLRDLPQALLDPADERVRLALLHLRAPRVVLAALVGLALGLAGALLQDGLRNPLAAPELLGVSSGCAVVVAAVAVLGVPVPRPLVPVAALTGGLAVGALCVLVGVRLRSTSAQILCGLACASFLSGCVIALVTLGAPANAALLYQYLLGSLANRGWADVRLVALWLAVAVPAGLLFARTLNTLKLGDDPAAALGVRVRRARAGLLVVATLLTAAAVAACGPIGFVALLAPHIVRRLLRSTDARRVLPLAALVGAVLLTAADQTARVVAEPREIAAGIVTVLVGAPVLLALIRSEQARSPV
ncbi:FecCD family ABC transporter permease [Nocardioides limicola]|uniref:FecCD family ABC transporter permease n=1 Tax=Nocardioides limicola TaxID=2803368 RepID=UPI00193BEC44|nr:iron ABC transporter permease [Nocardioides sp. DJM-14]